MLVVPLCVMIQQKREERESRVVSVLKTATLFSAFLAGLLYVSYHIMGNTKAFTQIVQAVLH